MTYTIEIDGIIGWDVWPTRISDMLKDANGDDVDILFSSEGGYISDGLAIFNHIYDYKGKTTAKLIGMAGSMSSYIPLAADKVIAKSNAVMMIHDALMFTYGNQEEHKENAELLGRFSDHLAEIYAKKSGKSVSEIRSIMKAETYYFGSEIMSAGFADEVDEIKFTENKDDIVSNAVRKEKKIINKLMARPENFKKIAAFFADFTAQNKNQVFAGATTFKDYPIYEKSWDSDAAVGRWREYSGSTEEPSRTYKNGFFWFDENAPDNFGSYKLPFIDIIESKIYAVRRGVFAANGAMSGARREIKIPEEDKKSVQGHIDKYLAKIERFDQEQEDLLNRRESAIVNNNRGREMTEITLTLDEFLAKNINARLDYEKRLHDAAIKAGSDKELLMKNNIERMRPIMQADGCSDALKQAGFDALIGKTNFDTFVALAEYEARLFEANNSKETDNEQSADTPPNSETENTKRPKNATDMKALAAELKAQFK